MKEYTRYTTRQPLTHGGPVITEMRAIGERGKRQTWQEREIAITFEDGGDTEVRTTTEWRDVDYAAWKHPHIRSFYRTEARRL